MWSHITLSVRPYWDLADYHIVATWKDSEDADPLVLTKEGTVAIGSDSDVKGVLRRVVEHLESPRVV